MKTKILNFIKLFFYNNPHTFTIEIHQTFQYIRILQHPIHLIVEAYSKQEAISIAKEMIKGFNVKYGGVFIFKNVKENFKHSSKSIFNLDRHTLIERQKFSFFYELENNAHYWFMNDFPPKKDSVCEKLN